MPVPNLIHPVDVTIEQIDTATTHYDHDAKEEIQVVARDTPAIIDGQVDWSSDMKFKPGKDGADEIASGYVIFRMVDLAAAAISISRGDRITKLGNIDTDVFVHRTEPQAHYPDQGGATLLKVWFEDRAPTRVP